MNNQKPLFTPLAVVAFAVAAMLAFSCAVHADTLPEEKDGSRIEKISTEEVALMLEQQKLLVVSFLAMQQKLELLQSELDGIKLQLTQLGARPGDATVSARVLSDVPLPTPGTQGGSAGPGNAVQQPAIQPPPLYLQNKLLFAAFGLVLSLLAMWLGLRYYARTRLRSRENLQPDAAPILKPAGNAAVQKNSILSAIKRPLHAGDHVPDIVLPPLAGKARNTATQTFQPSPEKTEENSMMEEAGLYAANGRMDKAAEILCEIIERNPSKTEAWTLLLSVYSALCRVSEFESTARKFLKHHKSSPSWRGIQVLGRTLDRDNPLYTDQSSRIAAAPLLPDALDLHRPIGDIMIEMGILSKREVLKYLDDFDPKQHGRFGGYLVARKAITIAQLDQALQQQQGVNAQSRPGDLPSLQDIEKFLADFDPKRHGSVSKYLASRNIASSEQLDQLLRQASSQGASAKKSQRDNSPAPDKAAHHE